MRAYTPRDRYVTGGERALLELLDMMSALHAAALTYVYTLYNMSCLRHTHTLCLNLDVCDITTFQHTVPIAQRKRKICGMCGSIHGRELYAFFWLALFGVYVLTDSWHPHRASFNF